MELNKLLAQLHINGITNADISNYPASLKSNWLVKTDETGHIPATFIDGATITSITNATQITVAKTTNTWLTDSALTYTNLQDLLDQFRKGSTGAYPGLFLTADRANMFEEITDAGGGAESYRKAAFARLATSNEATDSVLGVVKAVGVGSSLTVVTPPGTDTSVYSAYFVYNNFLKISSAAGASTPQEVKNLMRYGSNLTSYMSGDDANLANVGYVNSKTADVTAIRTPGIRWVNCQATSSSEHGTPANPYKTITAALAGMVSAWQLKTDWVYVMPGIYTESVVFAGTGMSGDNPCYGGIHFMPGAIIRNTGSNIPLTLGVTTTFAISEDSRKNRYNITGEAQLEAENGSCLVISGTGTSDVELNINIKACINTGATTSYSLYLNAGYTPTANITVNRIQNTTNAGDAVRVAQSTNLNLTVKDSVLMTYAGGNAFTIYSGSNTNCSYVITVPTITIAQYALLLNLTNAANVLLKANSIVRPNIVSAGSQNAAMISLTGSTATNTVTLDVRKIINSYTDNSSAAYIIEQKPYINLSVINCCIHNVTNADVIRVTNSTNTKTTLQNCYLGVGTAAESPTPTFYAFNMSEGVAVNYRLYILGSLVSNRSIGNSAETNYLYNQTNMAAAPVGGAVYSLGISDSLDIY